jgi:hypothetical protein
MPSIDEVLAGDRSKFRAIKQVEGKETMGRPEHKPDKRTRELVSALALNGVAQDRVAMHVGISEPSLRKHYRQELDLATESVCARVAKNLVRIASTGSGNAAVQACKYVLGAKAGWRDIGRLEVEHDLAGDYPPGESPREIILARLAAMADTREKFSPEPSDL